MNEIELILAKLKIVSEEKENGCYLCDKEHSKLLLDYINNLQKQLEVYENMRKEALDYLQYFNCDEICENITCIAKKLENILNKVGGSDE